MNEIKSVMQRIFSLMAYASQSDSITWWIPLPDGAVRDFGTPYSGSHTHPQLCHTDSHHYGMLSCHDHGGKSEQQCGQLFPELIFIKWQWISICLSLSICIIYLSISFIMSSIYPSLSINVIYLFQYVIYLSLSINVIYISISFSICYLSLSAYIIYLSILFKRFFVCF